MKENPQSNMITARTMYEYDKHTNIPWNDPQYIPVREYLDPVKQMNERKYAQQQKGKKTNKYVTKKGFYMDYHLKVVKTIPAPSNYNLKDPWDQTQNLKQGNSKKIDPNLMKYTYIQRIEMQQKNRKKPAPGSYNLNKTDSQIKQQLKQMKGRKISYGPKRYFYDDTQHLSSLHPGPGSQNPHLSVDHLKMNKTTPKFWLNKHKKQGQYWTKKKKQIPGPSSYSPCHVQFDSFMKISKTTEIMKKKKIEKKTGFGTDSKFAYDRPNKKKIIETRPAPSAYRMQIQWKGKDMDAKKNNWIRSRSTGFTRSLYN